MNVFLWIAAGLAYAMMAGITQSALSRWAAEANCWFADQKPPWPMCVFWPIMWTFAFVMALTYVLWRRRNRR